MTEPGAVEIFHRSTSHGDRPLHPERLVQFQPRDPANRPASFKRYKGLTPEPLPTELVRSSLSAIDVLGGTSGEDGQLDRETIGTILFLSAGVTRMRGAGEQTVWYRTAMSAGNLHPIEIYLLHEGLWHYQPLEHALVRLREASEVDGASTGATLILTGLPWRTCWKYRERGWRHLFWDAGTTVANALAVAAAHGIEARIEYGFDDEAITQLTGTVRADEVPLALLRLGVDHNLPPAGSLDRLQLEVEPIAPHPIRFPLLEEAQAAGNLTESRVDEWRLAAANFGHLAHATVESRPAGADTSNTIEDIILRRGSTRAFKQEAGSNDLLQWSLAVASRAVPSDLGTTRTLLDHFVSVHEIDGRPTGPASWHEPDSLTWIRTTDDVDDERAIATSLCLKQPLGGISAYTVFHCADTAALFAHSGGARAYRAAQLEAGIAAERLALCAFALGAGATGLTFFDSQVSRHFGTDTAPMLATAVGIAAAPPTRGGEPGHPMALSTRARR